MVAHAGEKAREAGMFHDQHCNGKGRVNKGAEIPKCPKCGGTPTMNELRKQRPLNCLPAGEKSQIN